MAWRGPLGMPWRITTSSTCTTRRPTAVARTATPELVRDVLQSGATDFFFGSFATREFTGRLAAILDGKLFVDYLSEAKRSRIRKKLEKERRHQAAAVVA